MGFQVGRERFQELFQHTSDGVIVIDRSLRILAINPSGERLTGCRADVTVGTRVCNEVAVCQNADGFDLCETNCPGLAAIERAATQLEIDVNFPVRGGQIAPAACLPMSAEDGSPLAMIVIRDVSDRTALQEQILAVERIDRVSGMYARSYFDEVYRREVRLAERQQRALAVVITSLSGKAGSGAETDEAIRVVSSAIRAALRRVDIAGRYDQTTFAAILLDADAKGAASLIARVQGKLAEVGGSKGLALEFGVGTTGTHGYEGLLQAAKQAVKSTA